MNHSTGDLNSSELETFEWDRIKDLLPGRLAASDQIFGAKQQVARGGSCD
jgi:hypothetical protein